MVKRSGDDDRGVLVRQLIDEVVGRSSATWLARIRSHLPDGLLSRVELDDVLQEATLRAIRRAGGFHGATRAEFGAWFTKVVDSTIVEIGRYWRRARRTDAAEVHLDDPSLLERSAALAGEMEPADTLPALRRALARMSKTQRRALELIAIDGLASDRAARRLGLTPPAFSRLLYRARSRAAQLLGARRTPPPPRKS